MKIRASLTERQSFRNRVVDLPPVENPIRIGVVGLGHRSVGNVISKVIRYEDYQLAAVCDLRPEIVKKVAADLEKDHGLKISTFTDYDGMLKNERLDAVAVQVDADEQVPLACQAMEAGLHVMMEVPVAYSLEHCWQLVTTVERTGKIFLLMEQLRYAGYVQAWRHIVQTGVIGKPLFVEGEYFGDKPDAFFQDDRGRFYSCQQAQNVSEAKPTWRHLAPTIGYLPHEMSPLLHILDDRVTRVVGMSVRNQSYRYENLRRADIQVALMHTEKDTIMRMGVAHSLPGIPRGDLHTHWHHIKGTEGVLEWQRSNQDQSKLWVDKWQLNQPIEIPWSVARTDGPPGAADSGHGGIDYYPFACFADAVLRKVPLEFDVYKAVETAAPAILAAKSIAEDNMPQEVPDFRPGPGRKPGEMPKQGDAHQQPVSRRIQPNSGRNHDRTKPKK